jgi:hypothetical protein
MARRRPDPRVTRYATPPLARLRAANANATLRVNMALATCSHAECENEPLVSKTKNGTIEYRCKEHLLSKANKIPRTLAQSGYWAA